jgi:hypothetical protein
MAAGPWLAKSILLAKLVFKLCKKKKKKIAHFFGI